MKFKSILGLIVSSFVAISAVNAESKEGVRFKSISDFIAKSELSAVASVLIFDPETGEQKLAHREQIAVRPASTLKLLTSYAALKKLGADFKFETRFFTDPLPQATSDTGIKIDTLYVQSGGDPSFVTERMALVADEFVRRGVRSVSAIAIDTTYAEILPRTGSNPYQAARGSVIYNHNVAEISVMPTAVGKDALVIDNFPAPQRVVSKVKTVLGSKKKISVVERHIPKSKDSADTAENVVTISGEIGVSHSLVREPWTVHDPIKFFANELRAALVRRSIEVGRTLEVKPVPESAKELFVSHSLPLRDIIQGLNRYSNNLLAHQVVLALGAGSKRQTSLESGVSVLRTSLIELGVAKDNFEIHDASGLEHSNRISASSLSRVMQAAWDDFAIRPLFVGSLTQYGVDGTLKTRWLPSSVQGRVWAKTGSLNNVSALAGFVQWVKPESERARSDGTGYRRAVNGRTYGFVILIDGEPSKEKAIAFEDRIVALLAGAN